MESFNNSQKKPQEFDKKAIYVSNGPKDLLCSLIFVQDFKEIIQNLKLEN